MFLMISSGTCSDIGWFPVLTREICEKAAMELRLADVLATLNKDPDKPEGCYYFSNSQDNSATLWIDVSPDAQGQGAETSDFVAGLLRQPICMPISVGAIPETAPPTTQPSTGTWHAETWAGGTAAPSSLAPETTAPSTTLASTSTLLATTTPPPLPTSTTPPPPPPATTTTMDPALKRLKEMCSAPGEHCGGTHCCQDPKMRCFVKDESWSSCKVQCTPGEVDPIDPKPLRTPWKCDQLGGGAASALKLHDSPVFFARAADSATPALAPTQPAPGSASWDPPAAPLPPSQEAPAPEAVRVTRFLVTAKRPVEASAQRAPAEAAAKEMARNAAAATARLQE